MYHNADFLSNRELKKLGFGKIGKNILISKNTTIVGSQNIFLEDNVRLDPFSFFLCPKGFIKIGKFTHVASHVFIAGHYGFKLGKFSGIGAGTKIYTSSEDYSGEGLCNLNLSLNWFVKNISGINISACLFCLINSFICLIIISGDFIDG